MAIGNGVTNVTNLVASDAVDAPVLKIGGVAITATAAQVNATAGLSQAAAQADSTATDVAGLKADVNALLAKLRAAGLLGN